MKSCGLHRFVGSGIDYLILEVLTDFTGPCGGWFGERYEDCDLFPVLHFCVLRTVF